MKTKLYDYQQKIVDAQKHKDGVALLLDMGVGKTVTSLAIAEHWNTKKILVLCVVSKLHDWQDDLKKELNIDAILLNKGTAKNRTLLSNNNTAYVINFEASWRLKELLKWVDNDTTIIIDEVQKCKNIKSKIGKFTLQLKGLTKKKMILTGTIQSRGYIDVYVPLNFVDIINVPYKMFTEAYCVYETQKYNGFPFKQLVGYKNTYTLDRIINENCVFFKRDLNNDQIPTDVNIALEKPKKYDAFKKVRIYEDYAADNVSKLFVTLRKMCSGNIDIYQVDDQKIKWLEELCEDLNDRLVIFYNFNFERDAIIGLMQKLKIPYSQYNGEVKDLTNFEKYDNGVAICQYMSASLGINNLVKSNICVMYSPSLNYIDYIQAKKRIDRIGQTKKPLFYNLYCKGTIEEKILQSIKKGITFDERMFEAYMKDNALPVKEVRK